MKRRQFFGKAGLASAVVATFAAHPRSVFAADDTSSQHDHEAVTGPLAAATMSFGQWPQGVDRFPNLAAPVIPNGHQLIPYEVKIKAGGAVNFIIAGFHLVLVYDDGTQPGDIDTGNTIAPTLQPVPPLINDPRNRIYRGLDPSTLPLLRGPDPPPLQDRVEVVRFANPGTYLVICGVLPHFVNDRMFGFVTVNP